MNALIEFDTSAKKVMLHPGKISFVSAMKGELTSVTLDGGDEVLLDMSYDDFRARLYEATAPRRFEEM